MKEKILKKIEELKNLIEKENTPEIKKHQIDDYSIKYPSDIKYFLQSEITTCKLKREEFANKIHVSKSRISQILNTNSKEDLSLHSAIKYLEALDCEIVIRRKHNHKIYQENDFQDKITDVEERIWNYREELSKEI